MIFVAFLLFFESFFISGFVNDTNSSFSNNTNSLFISKFFDSEGKNIVYSQQKNYSSLLDYPNYKPDYSGYIIEFEKPSLIEKKVEFKKIAGENDKLFLTKIPLIKDFFVTSDNLESKMQKYEKKLDEEHEEIKEEISKLNSKSILNEYKLVFNGISLNISDSEAKEIEKIEGVKRAWQNAKVEALLMDSVPLIQEGISAGKLGEKGKDCSIAEDCLTGEGVKIAIIDTGVDYTHQDLGGCLGQNCKVIGGYDFVNNDDDPMDDHGHGTHVAATAAGDGVLKGVAPGAQILAYKVIDEYGMGYMNKIISGIEKAVEDKANIISMSLGGVGNPDDPLSQATDNAVNAGVVAVVAAGNSGPDERTISTPGTARLAITVGASDKYDILTKFSSRGPVVWIDDNGNEKTIMKPDIVAPGAYICAAQYDNWLNDRNCLDNKHISISGTSMATPHVAGAVALLKQKNPDWRPEEIKAALKGTTKNLDLLQIEQGTGRIDIKEAVRNEEKMPISSIYAVQKNKILSLFGTAMADNFESYTLYLGDREIAYSDSEADNLLLYKIKLEELKDERNIFKLKVKSKNGKTSNDFVFVDVETIKLTSLRTNDIYRKGDIIQIKGDIVYDDYNLEVFYSKQYEDNWSSSGIIRKGEGWDTSLLSDGFYKIKIVFNVPGIGTFERSVEMIYLDSSLKKGWPQRIDFEYSCEQEDSNNNLFLTSQDKNVVFMTLSKNSGSYVINGLNNEPLLIRDNKLINYNNKYSIVSKEEMSSLSPFCYYYWAGFLEPVVADLNNDGNKEIVLYKAGKPPKILVYNQDGKLLWEKGIGGVAMPGGNLNIPLIGDLNNDGKQEIIAFSYGDYLSDENNSQIFALESNGSIMWSANISSNLGVTMLMADLNNDGNKEIIIKELVPLNPLKSRKLIILNSHKEIINLWDINDKRWTLFGSPESSPAIGNFDNDADFEIVIADPSEYAGGVWENDIFVGFNNLGVITIYNADGSIVEGWPRYTNGVIFSSPIVGDINDDGKDDIILGMTNVTDIFPDEKYGGLYAFDNKGNILSGWPYKLGYHFYSTPALGDINNDGKLEIAASSTRFETSLLYYNGSVMNGWPEYTAWNSWYSDIFADVTGSGQLNILTTAGGIYSCKNAYGSSCGGVYAWDSEGHLISGFPKVTEVDADAPLTVFESKGKINIAASSDWDFDYTKEKLKNRGSVYVWELNNPAGTFSQNKIEWPMFMHDTQHTGFYDYDKNPPTNETPLPPSLSKIENFGDKTINIILPIKIQKFEDNEWKDYEEIINGNYDILPKKRLYLAGLFNSKSTIISQTGTYRISVTLKDYFGKIIDTSNKEFIVYKTIKTEKDRIAKLP